MRRVLILLLLTVPAVAQTMQVKVIDRRDSETGYSYQIPGSAVSNSSGSSCSGTVTNTGLGNADVDARCSGQTTNTTYTAPQIVSYSVTGSTLSLLLPDNRIAVVNCASKWGPRSGAGGLYARRSCRIPLVQEVEVDFKGKDAKLRWPTSIDGKKFDSETYKILAVLPAK